MIEKELITEDIINDAVNFIKTRDEIYRTPCLKNVETFITSFNSDVTPNITLKLENLQNTGSFKIRGLMNQCRHLPADVLSRRQGLVTMSAGNYGKSYGYVLQHLNLLGACVMPVTTPVSRVQTVQSFGIEVELVPTSELISAVNQYVNQRGYVFLHSFDDINLLAAYASIADEILEDEPYVDIVLVNCGGGGLLAGIASRIKMRHPSCRVYGIEPENANTMHESFKQNKPVVFGSAKSIAGGLAPPQAGEITYAHCEKYVEDIILVSDAEIIDAVHFLFQRLKMVAEPSACAGFAALVNHKIPNVHGKKVVVVLSGGNITLDELAQLKP